MTDISRALQSTTTNTATTEHINTYLYNNNNNNQHQYHRKRYPNSNNHQYYFNHQNQDRNNDSYDDDDDNDVEDDDDDNIHDADNDEDDDDDVDVDDDNNDINSNDSIETISDELPVWAFGEQRWISGVNEDTTCSDLINVLLADEGIIIPSSYQNHNHHHHYHHRNHHHNNQTKHQQQKQTNIPENFLTSKLNDTDITETTVTTTTTGAPTSTSTTIDNNKIFVITERWRRVEQILSNDTKVLQIWSAWGQAKSEVKLTLRQIDSSLSLDISGCSNNNDKDSGMGSPIGSSNSAIMRRRKHRASKSTAAWVTQANTMHPKSQKTQIEKLMKLILEQGETIQQQLAKLRDRELQIAKIEEERHKNREKEHGKNYLLETYLNGLHEVEEKEVVTGNSDSGVQTEGALSSPEICSSSNQNEDEDYLIDTTVTQSTSLLASLPTPKIQKQNPKHYDCNVNNTNSNNNNISSLTSLSTPQVNSGTKITSLLPINGIRSSALNSFPFKEKPSHREKKLLKEHKQTKEYSSYLLQHSDANTRGLMLDGNAVTSKTITTATTTTLLSSLEASSTSPLNTFNAQQQNQNEQTKNLSIHLTEYSNDGDDNNNQHKDIKSLSLTVDTRLYNNNQESVGQHFHSGNRNNKKDDSYKVKDLKEDGDDNDNLSEKIQWMEKLVMINKHLQREEELLVRLGAKIRKYESENPLLDETQIREALCKVNNNLETGNMEIEKLELDLLSTKEELEKRSNLLQNLSKELIEKENETQKKQQQLQALIVNEDLISNSMNTFGNFNRVNVEEKKPNKKKSATRRVGFSNSIKVVDIPLDDDLSESDTGKSNDMNDNHEVEDTLKNSHITQFTTEINNNNQHEQDNNQLPTIDKISTENTNDSLPHLNKKDLVENLYSYSQYISKPNYDFNEKNESKNNKGNDEKLLSTNSSYDTNTNTLPLRCKTSTGILKNKNTPSLINNNPSIMQLQQQTNFQSTLPNLNPPTQMYIAPPPPGFDSPNYNCNDLLITAPTAATTIHTNQQYLVPSNQLTTTSFDQLGISLSLNHAKNLNFSKSSPIINSKNINPTHTLSKCDTIQKPVVYLCDDNSQSNTILTSINTYSNGNYHGGNTTSTLTGTITTIPIDRSLVSIPAAAAAAPPTVSPVVQSPLGLGATENFLILKKNYVMSNPPTTNHLLQRQPSNCNQINNMYGTATTTTDLNTTTPGGLILSSTNPNRNLTIKSGIVGGVPSTASIGINGINGINTYGVTALETFPNLPTNATNCIYNGNNNNNNNHVIGIGNHNSNIIHSNTNKLGPKRFINSTAIGGNNEFESNSDTGLSSLSDDVIHLGTLV